jgi:hypothetical protein
MKTSNKKPSGMDDRERYGSGPRRHRYGWTYRLLILLAVVAVAASCSTTGTQPVRPITTGKTIKSAADSKPVAEPVIQTATQQSPGITELEIYEGSGRPSRSSRSCTRSLVRCCRRPS